MLLLLLLFELQVEVFVIFSTNTDFTATPTNAYPKNHEKKTFQNELLNTNTNIYFDVATVSVAAALPSSHQSRNEIERKNEIEFLFMGIIGGVNVCMCALAY